MNPLLIPTIIWIVGCLVQLCLPLYIKARRDRKAAIAFGILWCLNLPFVIHDGWRIFGS